MSQKLQTHINNLTVMISCLNYIINFNEVI